MWFRNLQLYRLIQPFNLDQQGLHNALQGDAFKPCGSLETQRVGWVAPLGRDSEQLAHEASGCIMICMRREERLLPAAVVREAVEEKVAEIEAAEARPVHRKERMQLRDEITQSLLPKAFTRSSHLYAYVDKRNGWILVDSTSARRAEDLISLLRSSLGSIKVRPLAVQKSPAAVMTGWLDASAPGDVELADEAELREPGEEGGIVRVRRQDLGSDEIAAHLQAGKQVARVAVEWRERIGCVVCEDLSLRRLKFLELIQEQAAEVEAEDAATRFDADFTLMSAELAELVSDWIGWFGGVDEQDGE